MAVKVEAFRLSGRVEVDNKRANVSLKETERDAKAVASSFKGLKAVIGGFQKGFGSFSATAAGTAAGQMAGNWLTSGAKALFGHVTEAIDRGMEMKDLIEQMRIGFTSLEGSEEKAVARMRELFKFGADTPFQTRDILEYAQGLEAVHVQGDEVRGMLTDLGDALSKAGSFQKAPDAVRALVQMLGKGKVQAEELRNQLGEALPGAVGYMARALGVTQGQLDKLMEQGKLKAETAVRLMLLQMRKEASGAMKEIASKTQAGLKSTLEDAKDMLFASGVSGGDPFGNAAGAYAQRSRNLQEQINLYSGPDSAKIGQKVGATAESYYGAVGTIEKNLFQSDWFTDLLHGNPEGAKQKLSMLGGFIPAGLSEGVKAGAQGVVETVKDTLGGSVWDAVTGFWETNSPSKRTERLGEWLGQGLEIGLGKTGDAYQALLGLDGAMNGRGGRSLGGPSERERLERAAADPKVKAFFDTIARAEGGKINNMAGGRIVNSGARHPGEVVPMSQWFRTSAGPSSAAGLYQITRTNWRRLAPALGLDNFSDPHQQMLAALKLFSDRGGLPSLLSGDFETAMRVAAKDWTSTPGSRIGGGGQWSKSRWMGQLNKELAEGGTEMEPVGVTTAGVPVFAEPGKVEKWGTYRKRNGFPASPTLGGGTATYDAGNGVPVNLSGRTDKAKDLTTGVGVFIEPVKKAAGHVAKLADEVKKTTSAVAAEQKPAQAAAASLTELPKAASSTGLGLKLLEDSARKTAQSVAEIDAEMAALRAGLDLDPNRKKKKGVDGGFFSGVNRYRTKENEEGEEEIDEQADAAENAAAGVKATLKDLKAMGKEAFGSMAEGVGDIVENYILLGETGPHAMRKLTAQVLASASREATVKGSMSMADGFAHMFTNPAQSAADFTAAGIYFSVAAATGIAGRKLAGNLFNGKDGNPAHNAQEQNDRYANESNPDNRFTRRATGGPVYRSRAYLVGDGGRTEVFEPKVDGHVYPSVDAYEQARGLRARQQQLEQGGLHGYERLMHKVLGRMADQLERMETWSADAIVRMGAPKAKREIGHAAADSMHGDNSIVEKFQRRVAA